MVVGALEMGALEMGALVYVALEFRFGGGIF
jgi:hypothetical protein